MTVDELQIEISSKSEAATKGLDDLAAALGKIKAAAQSGLALGKISASIGKLAALMADMEAGA